MYYIDLNKANKINFKNQREIANIIGITEFTLSRILNGKQGTKKTTAYCITKMFDNTAEIFDYFKMERN